MQPHKIDQGDKSREGESNWDMIVRENAHLIGNVFMDEDGEYHHLFGIVHGDDDYYFGLVATGKNLVLISCLLSLEETGFTDLGPAVCA